MSCLDDLDDDLGQELLTEVHWQRRHQARLLSNPDCRDPDHPGCAACNDDHDEDNDNDE